MSSILIIKHIYVESVSLWDRLFMAFSQSYPTDLCYVLRFIYLICHRHLSQKIMELLMFLVLNIIPMFLSPLLRHSLFGVSTLLT
jgi:hypothetical protein